MKRKHNDPTLQLVNGYFPRLANLNLATSKTLRKCSQTWEFFYTDNTDYHIDIVAHHVHDPNNNAFQNTKLERGPIVANGDCKVWLKFKIHRFEKLREVETANRQDAEFMLRESFRNKSTHLVEEKFLKGGRYPFLLQNIVFPCGKNSNVGEANLTWAFARKTHPAKHTRKLARVIANNIAPRPRVFHKLKFAKIVRNAIMHYKQQELMQRVHNYVCNTQPMRTNTPNKITPRWHRFSQQLKFNTFQDN